VTYTQKYCIVSFLSNIAEGVEFDMKSWPLHVTQVGVFAIDDVTDIYNRLEQIAYKTNCIDTQIQGDAMFGDTKVNLVENTKDLYMLHKAIVGLLVDGGAVIQSPDHQLEGFKPHCTVQDKERVVTGQKITLQSISIIDMFPDANWQKRKTIKNYFFGS